MIRKRTIAALVLSVGSLLLITVDWRAAAIAAIVAMVFAVANLRSTP